MIAYISIRTGLLRWIAISSQKWRLYGIQINTINSNSGLVIIIWTGLVFHSLVPGSHARTVLGHAKTHGFLLEVGNQGVDVGDADVISGQEATVAQELFLDKVQGLLQVLGILFHFFFAESFLMVVIPQSL